jgi:hypothetical protein
MLPAGRARLATQPSATGSLAVVKTIGIFVFVAFAASAAGVLVAAMTGHLTANQFGGKLRQAFVVVFSPAILDDDVLTFDKAHLVKPASEFTQEFRVELRCRAIEKTDDGH